MSLPAPRRRITSSSAKARQMNRQRDGLTLLELVVVIGIFGIILSLLLTAVQSARESARRMTCQNNLRQVVLAVVNHESSHASLPNLYNGQFLLRPPTVRDEFHFHSWRTEILPHIEQNALYTRLERSLAATDKTNQSSVNVSLSIFVCPSTPNKVVPDIEAFNNGKPSTSIGTAARSDFEVTGGVAFASSGTVDLQNVRFGPWGEPLGYRQSSVTYRKPRLRDTSDGLSNTILLAERAGRPDLYERGKPVNLYPFSLTPGFGMDNHQATWAISTHFWWLVLLHQRGINESNQGIFSFHGGGALVAIADGSVRFLADSTDQGTLNALVTRASGEVVLLD